MGSDAYSVAPGVNLLEGWCAGDRVTWGCAGEKGPSRKTRAFGGDHYEKLLEQLRLNDVAEVYRGAGKDLSILVQGIRVDLVMRMLELVRQTRGVRRFVMVPVVSMGMPFVRKRMLHRNPDREQVCEQGEGRDEDASESTWVSNAHVEA